MKTIDFNVEVLDLAGAPIYNGTQLLKLGALLAPKLVEQTAGDALKFWSLALSIYRGEELTLDLSDVKLLREFVNTTDQLNNLVKAQLLIILDK